MQQTRFISSRIFESGTIGKVSDSPILFLVFNTSTDRDVFVHGHFALGYPSFYGPRGPPSLSPKVEYQRDVGHDASLTADAVHATPTVGIHNRDLASEVAGTTAAHRIPLMPPFDDQYTTTTVTHTATTTEYRTASSDSTNETTITQRRTTTMFVNEIVIGYSSTISTNNASLNRTVPYNSLSKNGTAPYNSLSKNVTASTDNKCGAKVEQTCIDHPDGRCCSMYGYCGETDAHCGAGCQSGYGVCGAEGYVDKNPKSTALKSIKSLAPLLDRVLVQRIKAQTQTAGGIFLPESSVKELNEARVLAVGPGGLDKEGKNVKPSVKAGDKVLIPQYGGSPVKVGEEEYALFRDYELLAKINE
ncbi:hypothetical protein V500_09965 [Pseudogymnoascus sp. VKM F-4518 (FW-2643)]|nr:hypothetical protein V500_09965 [Pseudogymnoascus sp. VKM F-4518 (FW-2643)]